MGRSVRMLAIVLALAAVTPATALAARHCDEPRASWERATPAEAGMDAAKLQSAVDYGSAQLSLAVRVYRWGCLVTADRLYAVNRDTLFESWSKAKSITSLVFGRAMTLGLISPDDRVGALLPEADAAHGNIKLTDLLTQTSGLHWEGLRDYDIFMPDRLRDALTVGIDHPPGTYYEYSQSGPALLAEAVQRAVGEDFQAFAQRELFTTIGIQSGSWHWTRDTRGHTQGFYGLNMRPDDYGRLGELMRRGGVWRGRRLLSESYVRQAVTPSRTNGCYGWLIWVNAAKPCIGSTVVTRPFSDTRNFPGAPPDMFNYEGLFGQIVAVMPTQGIIIERNGQDPGLLTSFAGGTSWEAELYRRVLGSIIDQRYTPPGDAGSVDAAMKSNVDYGFARSLTVPGQIIAPLTVPPLPPRGPARARAVQLPGGLRPLSASGKTAVELACPAVARLACSGTVRLLTVLGAPASAAAPFTIAPGHATRVALRVTRRVARVVRRRHRDSVLIEARTTDTLGGDTTRSWAPVALRRA
jgi:CubicO group peptidase (beta-lactamase class C family)